MEYRMFFLNYLLNQHLLMPYFLSIIILSQDIIHSIIYIKITNV